MPRRTMRTDAGPRPDLLRLEKAHTVTKEIGRTYMSERRVVTCMNSLIAIVKS